MTYGLYSVWECWWLAPLALLLDLCLGDPKLPWPHPVCLAGRLLARLEGPARHWMERGGAERRPWRGRLAGLCALLVLVCCTGLAVWLLIGLPLIGPLLAVYLAWAGLALGSLLGTGREVLRRVESRPVPDAREAVSWLVSRDTSRMDRPLLRKTLADTLSENLTDALLAPFFWLLLAGPVGLWCYKAVSTTDSMWGYMTEKWRWLGWAGARGDDLLAFVPARFSVVALWFTDRCFRSGLFFVRAAARFRPGADKKRYQAMNSAQSAFGQPPRDEVQSPAGRAGGFHPLRQCRSQVQKVLTGNGAALPWDGLWPGFGVIARQAAGMPSPNSGWPMTACAWLCRARMAGPSVYFGALTPKPWLGPPESEAAPWDAARLLALCALLRYSALCGALLLWLGCLALCFFSLS
ncbi:CobD/CbiB family cobalamin biosynthesis protein [Desulfovibrio sp. ZJ369]|uniref:CobD/CbiB family cobalamin biosynthesis protein n=1 Tax=Desulfovibrio sp. ZJ369 TaxID=2709793 RepID=UPI0013EC0DE4|nr:CobD/CbiB family cobalamin biosynthesis protein [Desulfovibrio sp. ZJ369]